MNKRPVPEIREDRANDRLCDCVVAQALDRHLAHRHGASTAVTVAVAPLIRPASRSSRVN